MKLVKVERGDANAEGILDGDSVRIVGGWRDGPADLAAFTLPRISTDELRRHATTDTVPRASVTLAVPIDPLAKIFLRGHELPRPCR